MRFIDTGCSHRCMFWVGWTSKSFLTLTAQELEDLAGWLQLHMLPSGAPWIGHEGQRGVPGLFHAPKMGEMCSTNIYNHLQNSTSQRK